MPDNPSFEAYVARTQALIDKYGWAVQGVGPEITEGKLRRPAFSYTIGLTAKNLPELSIYGLGMGVAHQLLNMLASEMVNGRSFVPGELITDLANMPFHVVRSIDLTDLSAARHFYDDKITALQVVWPDPAGKFPWEDDFDIEMLPLQPLSGSPE